MRKTGKHRIKIFLVALAIILVATGASSFALTESIDLTKGPIHQSLVAHAGGQIYGFRYTNSLEAIENSYNNGSRLIELDFEWTSDNEVVSIHDWTGMAKRLLHTEGVFSYAGFKNTAKFMDLNLMHIHDLATWLEEKEDAYIITDCKSRNIEFMETISKSYGQIKNQIIPQVYSFEEYARAKELGYENIIFTSYKSTYTNEEIVEFARNNTLFAVTMTLEEGSSELPMKLKELDVISYVHTVNDLYIFEELNTNGVYGIYTDYFQANKWID